MQGRAVHAADGHGPSGTTTNTSPQSRARGQGASHRQPPLASGLLRIGTGTSSFTTSTSFTTTVAVGRVMRAADCRAPGAVS